MQISHVVLGYRYVQTCYELGEVVFGGLEVAKHGTSEDIDLITSFFASIISYKAGEEIKYMGEPMSSVFYPIFDSYDFQSRKPVAVLMSVISWADFLREILPPGTDGVLVVIENTCDGAFSYRIDGPAVTYLGSGSQLESKFAGMVMVDDHLVHDFENSGLRLNEDGECTYQISWGRQRLSKTSTLPENPSFSRLLWRWSLFSLRSFLVSDHTGNNVFEFQIFLTSTRV